MEDDGNHLCLLYTMRRIQKCQASSHSIQGRMEPSDPLYKEVPSQWRVCVQSSSAKVNMQLFVTLSLLCGYFYTVLQDFLLLYLLLLRRI